MENKKEKVIAVIVAIALFILLALNYENKIKDITLENDKLANENYELKNKVEKYLVALDAANENIDLGNEMILEARGFAGSSFKEMSKALEELGIIEKITNLEDPREKDPISEIKNPKADKDNCESAGGKWSTRSLSKIGVCNMPSSSAGKECTDESECDGACIAESAEATEGKCSEWTVVLGCRYHMKSGSAVSVCSD